MEKWRVEIVQELSEPQTSEQILQINMLDAGLPQAFNL